MRTNYLSIQLIGCIKSTVSWSSNGKSWISGPTIPLYVSITYEAMEDNLCYIVNWSWKPKSRTSTRGAAVRDWLSNCGVAGSVTTRLRWLRCWRVSNRTKQRSSAPASFWLSTLLINDEFLIKNSNKIPYYLQTIWFKFCQKIVPKLLVILNKNAKILTSRHESNESDYLSMTYYIVPYFHIF